MTPGWPEAGAAGLRVPEAGGGEGLAGEDDRVHTGGGRSVLRNAEQEALVNDIWNKEQTRHHHPPAVRLQHPGDQFAEPRVRGHDVQLVGLLDVDGEVGDRLAGVLQHRLGLVIAHGL